MVQAETNTEPSVPAREFNLKAYAAITWHNDPASLGLEPRLADHRSQAARTATLPTAPPRQADSNSKMNEFESNIVQSWVVCCCEGRRLALARHLPDAVVNVDSVSAVTSASVATDYATLF